MVYCVQFKGFLGWVIQCCCSEDQIRSEWIRFFCRQRCYKWISLIYRQDWLLEGTALFLKVFMTLAQKTIAGAKIFLFSNILLLTRNCAEIVCFNVLGAQQSIYLNVGTCNLALHFVLFCLPKFRLNSHQQKPHKFYATGRWWQDTPFISSYQEYAFDPKLGTPVDNVSWYCPSYLSAAVFSYHSIRGEHALGEVFVSALLCLSVYIILCQKQVGLCQPRDHQILRRSPCSTKVKKATGKSFKIWKGNWTKQFQRILSQPYLSVLVWFSPGLLHDSTSKVLKAIKHVSIYHWVSLTDRGRKSVKLNLLKTRSQAYVFLACMQAKKQCVRENKKSIFRI